MYPARRRAGTKQKSIQGRVLAIQEDRFRIKLPKGQVYLLTLGKGANIGMPELASLQASQTQVRVEFIGEPNMESGKALAVRPVRDT